MAMVYPNLLETRSETREEEGGTWDAPKMTTKANKASPTASSLPSLDFLRATTMPDNLV